MHSKYYFALFICYILLIFTIYIFISTAFNVFSFYFCVHFFLYLIYFLYHFIIIFVFKVHSALIAFFFAILFSFNMFVLKVQSYKDSYLHYEPYLHKWISSGNPYSENLLRDAVFLFIFPCKIWRRSHSPDHPPRILRW